jgi:hypothetical protein
MKGEKSTGFEGRRVLEETNERESETGELVRCQAWFLFGVKFNPRRRTTL